MALHSALAEGRMHHGLACRTFDHEPVRLHRAFPSEARRKLPRLLDIAEGSRPRRRNPVPLHEILRESFRRFELRRLLIRTPNPEYRRLEVIHNPSRKRIVRPNHRQIDPLDSRERTECREVVHVGYFALDLFHVLKSFRGDPRIPWRAPHLFNPRRLRQFPHQRMFPPARTND